MNNEELKDNLISDEIQAVTKSELLPIYENMNFAGDIQPLDDVEISEEVRLSYSGKKSDIKSEKKKVLKKINFDFFLKNANIPKIIISAVLILAVIGGIIAIAGVAVKKADNNNTKIENVYVTSANSTVMTFSNGTSKEIASVQKTKVSKNGRYLYYAKSTASKTGKYDLYVIDCTSRKSVKKGGKFVEIAVDENWQITNDGEYACYSITRNNTTSCYIFNAEKNKSELIADSVKQAFLPYNGDVVYYTRGSGDNISLQCKRMGESSELVASKVSYATMAKGDDGFELLYAVPTGTSTNVDVLMTDGVNEPKTVCKNVSEVYLDSYKYKGNLYYFTKDNSTVNWQDFIEDEYYDTDATMEKPVEGDYMVEKGFIFKRYVLDSNAYDKAKDKYNEKMIRDTVRAALSDLDLGLAVKDEYSCYVYENAKSTKLVNGVTLDNIIDFTAQGEPRIIYRKSTIGVDEKISLDKLVSITKKSGIDSAVDYVNDMVGDSYELSNNCNYARFDENKVLSYEIKEYKLSQTNFIFGSANTLYAVCDGDLYCNKISSLEMSKRSLIDTGVEDETVNGDAVFYTKNEYDETKTLYKYTEKTGKEKICSDVYSYFVTDKNVIVMARNSESETIDVGIYDMKSYKKVDTDISLDKFIYTENSFSYLKNYTNNNGGDLYCYLFADGAKKCAANVVDVIFTV